MAAKEETLTSLFSLKKPQSKSTIPINHHSKEKRKEGESLLGEGIVKELEQPLELFFNLVRLSKRSFQQLWEDF